MKRSWTVIVGNKRFTMILMEDCDPVTEAVCTARNDVMIESLGVCCG